MKKALSIAAIVAIIIAVGFTSYYYFFYDGVDPKTGEKVGFREFLPFGKGSDNEPPSGGETQLGGEIETTTQGNVTVPVEPLPAFHKIGNGPIAGFGTFAASSTAPVRYIDRATGHVHEYDLLSGRDEKISNTTIPKIRETVWLPGAKSAVLRYASEDGTVESFFGNLANSTTTGTSMELKGGFLPKNLDIVISMPGTAKIFTITKTADGANGFVSDVDGGNRVLVFRSPVREWLAQGVSADIVALTTKPASYAEGYLYLYNLKSGKLTKLVGDAPGLTAKVNSQGTYALYSEITKTGIELKLYDVRSNTSKNLGLSTLADKCVWNKGGTTAYCAAPTARLGADYVDLWYQGVASESDNLWTIDANNGVADLVWGAADVKQNELYDAYELQLDAKERHLLFLNKRDLGLWTLNLFPPDTAQDAS